ncbi:MAG: 6-carboxytetrahydropterin synthase [Deltaproteobacteria bacterium]|nr:6-carboxytetrahydropterin synthase [Deltaproteobacteria bacterium]
MSHTRLICRYPFCAAHRLWRSDWSEETNKKHFGRCTGIHGHDYRIEVHLTGDVSRETGMLINGFAVDEIVGTFISKHLDHKYLNQDIPFFSDHLPTAEMIAFWVYSSLKASFPSHVTLEKIVIFETPDLIVEYSV